MCNLYTVQIKLRENVIKRGIGLQRYRQCYKLKYSGRLCDLFRVRAL